MTAPIFGALARDWHAIGMRLRDDYDDATDWFHRHHQPQPYDGPHQPQEETMPLADTSASLSAHKDALKAALQDLITKGHEALDQHLPGIEQDAAAIAEDAATSQDPIVLSALGAAHVPQEQLSPVAALLDALAAAHPKPAEDAPAEPAAADDHPAAAEQVDAQPQ